MQKVFMDSKALISMITDESPPPEVIEQGLRNGLSLEDAQNVQGMTYDFGLLKLISDDVS